jgi:DNA-binding transcriptional LysR family regulator
MLEQSDMLAVVSAEVGHYYAAHGLIAIVPLDIPCHMDAFGIITRTDRVPSPAAKVMMDALRTASRPLYGQQLQAEG